MPSISASAPGKAILFGEHAVVYGEPAVAVPVTNVKAKAYVRAQPSSPDIIIDAPVINLNSSLGKLPVNHPIAVTLENICSAYAVPKLPAMHIRITSTIPVASGLGSGAATTVAIIRAVTTFLGHPLPDEKVSGITFEVEKLHHGSPSGIDNTVVTYKRPIFFIRDLRDHDIRKNTIEFLQVKEPFTIVIGDTGIQCPTAITVNEVRKNWTANQDEYGQIFKEIGCVAEQAREFIEDGSIDRLGDLMNTNHTLLQNIAVSSPQLDHLVTTAINAGALGAKLSGGGRGGNMIAITHPSKTQDISEALQAAGATKIIISTIGTCSPARGIGRV